MNLDPDGIVHWIVASAAVLVSLATWWRYVRPIYQRRKKARQQQLQFLLDWNGHDGDSKRRVPPLPGVLDRLNATDEKVNALVEGQSAVTTVAEQAANDVAAIRTELTRNHGTSTKDGVHQAARSAEAAAAAAELAKQSAERTEALVRRHVANGVEIMAVGVHNDERLFAALAEKDIHVTDLKEYPPVDLGDD